MSMHLRILAALLRKEVTLMMRHPLIPKIILVMPLMVMLVIPLVANMDVKQVNVAVVDCRPGMLSRRLVADLDAAEAISVTEVCRTPAQALAAMEHGRVDVILTIPADLGPGHPALVEANGVNATRGMLGSRYVSQAVAGSLTRIRAESGASMPQVAEVSVANRYNPTLNFRNYMIPALMVVLLILICGFLPALNLVEEKESGTIKAINVTPVGRFTFVLSKLIPYWVAGLIVVSVGMLVGWTVYGLVPEGSITAIYLAAVLFSLIMSGLGVFIANRSATMLQSIFVMFACIMIFQLMGGLFTPIASMPQWAGVVTYAIPPRYFIEIMRAIYLKGATPVDLWPQYTALALLAALTCTLAATSYRKRS